MCSIAQIKKESAGSEYVRQAAEQICVFARYEDKTVYELSRDENIQIETLSDLWIFLNGGASESGSADLYIDLYYLFLQLDRIYAPEKEVNVRGYMKRWGSGTDDDIVNVRERNKERIIALLVTKLEQRRSPGNKFRFSGNLTYKEKFELVRTWWNDYKFHLNTAIKSPLELNIFLGGSLSRETMKLLYAAKKKGMPFFITPYYLSLLSIGNKEFDDSAIRSYVIYTENLVNTYGSIKAWEREDVVVAGEPNAAGWILPNSHNIHRRYPDVAIMIPDSMGRACGGLCAVCQRMYDFQSERLNFDFISLVPKETWGKKLARLMKYFEDDTQLRDILITGGDALMSQNATLRKILDAVYKMALNKQKANLSRPEGAKYAELQRVRLGSRLPAYLPMRVNDELISILKDFRLKASRAGVSQFIIQTHFQSPLEVTPEAVKALKALISAGWTVTNQLVFTVAASRRGHTAKLRKVLNKAGVVCYYTFSVKGFEENYALYAPNSRSLQESEEEKSAGKLDASQTEQLMKLIGSDKYSAGKFRNFLKENQLPFAATDRNVLNLPGIGKSMTFVTVGITEDGRRVQKFSHDHTRRHSPIIDELGEVYIVENKSIAAYLRQLKEMGENIHEYSSIWSHRSGMTEPRFKLYEYPDYPFDITTTMTNLKLD